MRERVRVAQARTRSFRLRRDMLMHTYAAARKDTQRGAADEYAGTRACLSALRCDAR